MKIYLLRKVSVESTGEEDSLRFVEKMDSALVEIERLSTFASSYTNPPQVIGPKRLIQERLTKIQALDPSRRVPRILALMAQDPEYPWRPFGAHDDRDNDELIGKVLRCMLKADEGTLLHPAVLKKVANAGASVLFTIHQPASEIFNAFDRLILLNKGRVMFQGLVDDVPDYFAERDHPLPKNYNPADWIMNVAQANTREKLDKDGFFPKDERTLPEPFKPGTEGRDELGITVTQHSTENYHEASAPGVPTQVAMLFAREIKNLTRDTAAVGARFGLTVFLGLLVGLLFRNVG